MKTLISGFGGVCALGGTIEEISQNLFYSSIKPSYIKDRIKSVYAIQYPVFQAPENILSQKEENESYGFLFLRKALTEAMEKAGLQKSDLKNLKVGACIGTSVDASFNCFDFYKEWRKDIKVSLEPLNKYIKYSISSETLKFLDTKGLSQTIVTACASGTDAIGIGAEWIENGFCDIVIAGGADELNLIPFTGFIKLMISSKDHCKPFDKNRNGINLGEGAGIFILESHNSLKKRNGKKFGSILGYGNACDGYHATAPDPQGRGLRKALNFAVEQAGGLSKEKFSFINAHATGTVDNDAAEAKVFNDLFNDVLITSTKSCTGHALGAAGAIEACISLICLNEQKVPKTNNFDTVDENLNIVPVSTNLNIDGKKAAISDSLAFGGCNACIVLGGKNYE
ncbi:MAG: beta-ketoacyl-[acyl-carrier-protein] synthase family protein [Endomicrobium sp.]|jgi:3-oxoacyl-(acyl-carrier-protein) synthase|nr:beta-ketoacyl-[acyl-carrier-protein] synthase family protein [Endomicrobium sp.]